jgi:hypothetical protein
MTTKEPLCLGHSAAEALKAEHLQPVRMVLAGEQLCRRFAAAFRLSAAQIRTMVEEKAQQRKAGRADITAQEKVVAQAAVEVFHQGTGPVEVVGQYLQLLVQGEETPAQMALKFSALLPIGVGVGGEVVPVQQFTYRLEGYCITACQLSECLIEVAGECQQGIALISETLA